MDFHDLEAIALLKEYGVLAEVAKAEGTSPATITRRIKTLEKELGVTLLHRRKNYIILNEIGQLVAEHADEILRAKQSMTEEVRKLDEVIKERKNAFQEKKHGKSDRKIRDELNGWANLPERLVQNAFDTDATNPKRYFDAVHADPEAWAYYTNNYEIDDYEDEMELILNWARRDR